MRRSTVVAAAALAAGCGSENNFGDRPPEWPISKVPPLDEIEKTDVLVQVTTPMVDILWMVDNSCSMSNDQTDLTENFPHFMEFFAGSGLDYHIGITSSDISNGSSYRGAEGTLVVKNGIMVIDPRTPDPILQFQRMATLGVTGRYPERGLGATYLALEVKRDTMNAGFYRDDASIVTIIISDEPDYTLAGTITQPEYVQWYQGLKEEMDMRSFSAIIDTRRGSRYEQTAEQIGGIVWDLNDGNWPQVLERLGLQAAGFKREYFLSQLPVEDTIEVSVETLDGAIRDFAVDVDWTYDPVRNSITFLEFIPDELSKVRIHYTLVSALVDVEDEEEAPGTSGE
jgi:hypothetical protein